jgi:hypothetical protein
MTYQPFTLQLQSSNPLLLGSAEAPVRISVPQHHYRCYEQPITALRLKFGFIAASKEFSIKMIEMTEKERGGTVL